MISQIRKDKKYLSQLSAQYPSIQSVCTEIINLRAILYLPKGTEHFVSDLHGEYEAFSHILNNCSGVIREKVEILFKDRLSDQQKSELCTLIYYPNQKLLQIHREEDDPSAWCRWALLLLIELCKLVASKYTRSKVRKALPQEFAYIIDEFLHADYSVEEQSLYYEKIMDSIISLQIADEFIIALSTLIKRLAVARLHVVGDIFDRGPRPDLIMDMLMDHHSVDIQWGNHDILWMAAAAGHSACAMSVIVGSASFANLCVLEEGYGINLRQLAMFADKTYSYSKSFSPRLQKGDPLSEPDKILAAKIHKAAAIMLFKLEGQLLLSHPEYGMENRLLLDKINFESGTVNIGGKVYPLLDSHFPTIDPHDPYKLTLEEEEIVREIKLSFMHSKKLRQHIAFLYKRGGIYNCYNQNLMFHGCLPTCEDGEFARVEVCGIKVSGKALMDRWDSVVRTAYFGHGVEKQQAMDGMWYLWCGKLSPVFGRDRMTTFERRLIADESTHTEIKNPYYRHINDNKFCLRLMEEFGLYSEISHIVNGHMPVKAGENPLKGGGKLIVIDGGFCRAYHHTTGVAGYTLIYNSHGLRISAHNPFEGVEKAIAENLDIHSSTNIFETLQQRVLVMDTDVGQEISERIYDLSLLLSAYRLGEIESV